MQRRKKILKSFNAAFHGFWHVLRHELTFKYMLAAAALVLGGMAYFDTSRQENIALLTMIFAVLGLELINSALERFLDFLNPDHDERIKDIKDVMAAIVLLVVLGATVIGILIFLPHIQSIFS